MLTRIAQFILYVILTVCTIGFYPIYFLITRIAEANRLQRKNNELVAEQVELLKKLVDTQTV